MNLNDSTLFDGRLYSLISKVLQGRATSYLNPVEKEIVDRASEIIELNRSLNPGVISYLQRSSNYLSVSDALYFLLESQRLNILEDGVEALELIVTEQKRLTRDELEDLILESVNMPMAWAVPLIGSNEERGVSNEKPKKTSSLDLDRLRDFR